MKKITLLMTLLAFTFGFSQAQKTDYADFKEAFGGTVHTPQSFQFPTGAESWAGFANVNTSMYPLVFENGGSVKFDAPASAVGAEVRFRFEYLPHPNVDPAYDTAVHTITEGANEIAIPSQGNNTFSSFIMYVVTPDVELTINSINVETLDADGQVISTDFADFKEAFGGTVYTPQSFQFPAGAESWAGFANMNTSMYPLVFGNDGSINFDAPASAVGAEVRFRFEYLPHPNVDPAYDTAVHTITEGANEIAIPSQGSNTFSSFILYVVTADVALSLNSISVTSDGESDDNDDSSLPSSYYADFNEAFGGTVYAPQTFTFPTGAESWAGFANMNTSMYPLSIENGGKITFTAPATSAGSEIRFRFEYQPHPNVDPAYDTAVHTITEGANEIAIPSQGNNTFSSFIMYVVTPDVAITISNVNITTFDTDGTTELETEYAYFKEAFGGTVYTHQSFTFPTGAESWAGFANMNTSMYPLSFENGGTITFDAVGAAVGTEVRFRFEYQPHPNVDPAYDTAVHTITEGANEIAIPSQGNNTFSSFIMYVVTPDVAVTLDLVKVTSNAATAGVEDNVFNSVKMFPNPARDYVQFSVNSNEDLDIQIFDMLGKSVLRVDNVRNAVNVSELNAGLYFVQMTLGAQQATKKLVIK